MKYNVSTYEDFLNLTPAEVNKIIDDDFDNYSDDEMTQLMKFIAEFNLIIYNITHKSVSLVIEQYTKKINIFSYTNRELLQYFTEHPNE